MAGEPSPARLGRAEIIETALAIADRDGLSGVSMHGVAKALGVGTMTLYTYVDGKEDLLDGMADHCLALIVLPEDGAWDERIRAAILATRDVADVHPSLAELIMTRAPATDVKRDRHNHTAVQLRRGGLSDVDADHASQMLWGLVGGMLLGQRTGVFSAAELVVGHNRPEAESRTDLEFAVDVVLDGLRLRARHHSEAGNASPVM